MTLHQKIKLIDDLIREDKEATIRDYIDLVKELLNIETASVIKLTAEIKKAI